MASNIDATKPADGIPAVKSELRANLAAAKAEIEALQNLTEGPLSAKDFGLVADGLTDDGPALLTAVAAADTQNRALILPAGDINIVTAVQYIISPNGTLRLYSYGGTRIVFNSTIQGTMAFDGTVSTATTLSLDAAIGAIFIEVADVTDMEVNDLLWIDTETPVESGWNYDKQCIRRIAGISGTTIYLDQKLDFFFTVAESTEVKTYKPAYFYSDNIDYYIPNTNGRQMALRKLSGGMMSNGTIQGPVEGWQPGFTDGLKTVNSDRIIYDNFNFYNLRYGPTITGGSRYTTVKNCWALNIRHLDTNAWAQDTLFENIVGISTDGLIQSHPSIRNTFRHVRDSVAQTNLYGLDLRGVGEIVEDCESHSDQGVGQNTQRPLLRPDYVAWGQNYTRRITRFRSATAVISCGHHAKLIVEQCEVPRIDADGDSKQLGAISIDEDTKTTVSFQDNDAGISQVEHVQPARVLIISPIDAYARSAAPTVVTGITQANPGVVTSPTHGLADGDFVRITNPTGMDELDYNVYKAANVTTNTFEINTIDDEVLDTTGFTAYVSDGFVAKHQAAKAAVRGDNLHVGRFPYAHYRVPNLGDGSAPVTVMITTETGQVNQRDRWGYLTVRARGDTGFSEATYYYTHDVHPGFTPPITLQPNMTNINGATITVDNVTQHLSTAITAEGSSIFTKPFDSYWSFDITIGATVRDVEVEIKEWVRNETYEHQTFV